MRPEDIETNAEAHEATTVILTPATTWTPRSEGIEAEGEAEKTNQSEKRASGEGKRHDVNARNSARPARYRVYRRGLVDGRSIRRSADKPSSYSPEAPMRARRLRNLGWLRRGANSGACLKCSWSCSPTATALSI
jgi:hypothetical protein